MEEGYAKGSGPQYLDSSQVWNINPTYVNINYLKSKKGSSILTRGESDSG